MGRREQVTTWPPRAFPRPPLLTSRRHIDLLRVCSAAGAGGRGLPS
ncbi:putative leader peptide [Streptomyces sp. enrichment culture]